MPFAPPSVRSFSDPADQIEPMTRYIITLVSLEDTGVSIYEKDKARADAEHSYLWKWHVVTNDGEAIMDGDEQWEFWEWTGNRTGNRQDGTPGKARARIQALVGRELTDEDMTRFVANEANIQKLPGRRAYATFDRIKKPNKEGDIVDRVKIQAIMPFKGGTETPAPPPAPPKPEPEPEPEPIATQELAF